MASNPSEKELRAAIKVILKGVDLNSLSVKKVRLKLQDKFGTDLSSRKQEIDNVVMELITNDDDDEGNQEASDGEDNQSGHSEEASKPDKSESEQEVEEEEPPKKKHKKKKERRERDDEPILDPVVAEAQNLNDEELAKRLQDIEEGGRRTRRAAAPLPRKDKTPKEKKKREGSSAYTKPCILSPDLAGLMGTDRMARNEVVKKMWEIVKERKLEDPKDKRFMVCDEELQNIFGKKRVQTFGMMKYLKHHIKDEGM